MLFMAAAVTEVLNDASLQELIISQSEAVGAQCSPSCPTGPHIPPALQHIACSFLPSLAALSVLVESFVHHCFCNAPLVAQGAFAKE